MAAEDGTAGISSRHLLEASIKSDLASIVDDMYDIALEEEGTVVCYKDVATLDSRLVQKKVGYVRHTAASELLKNRQKKYNLLEYTHRLGSTSRRRSVFLIPRNKEHLIHKKLRLNDQEYTDVRFVRLDSRFIEEYARRHNVSLPDSIPELVSRISHPIFGEICLKEELDTVLGLVSRISYNIEKSSKSVFVVEDAVIVNSKNLAEMMHYDNGYKPTRESVKLSLAYAKKKGFMFFRGARKSLHLIVQRGQEKLFHRNFRPDPSCYGPVLVAESSSGELPEIHHADYQGLRYAGARMNESLQYSSIDLHELEQRVQRTFTECRTYGDLESTKKPIGERKEHQFSLAHIISADTTFPILVTGELRSTAEKYLLRIYNNIKVGKCIWPLANNVVDKDAKQLAEEKGRIDRFVESYEAHLISPSEESLIDIFDKIPRLRRGYVAVVAQSLGEITGKYQEPKWRTMAGELDKRIGHIENKGGNTKELQAQGRPVLLSDITNKGKESALLLQRYQRVQELSLQARNILTEGHVTYLRRQARFYQTLCLPEEEAHQAAWEGVLLAAGRFDPSKGNLFETYAKWWIKREAITTLERNTGVVLGSDGTPIYTSLRKVARDYGQEFHEEIPYDRLIIEVAEATGKTPEYVESIAYKIGIRGSTVSLDSPIYADGTNLHEKVADRLLQDRVTNRRDADKVKARTLYILDRREGYVLMQRIGIGTEDGEGRTLASLGKELGCTHECVRRRYQGEALVKIGAHYGLETNELKAALGL